MVMVKVPVKQVDGIRVFAGGKWLICIGNKPVSVGEYVWTDGKCVYGNERIGYMPYVYISIPGIPIVGRLDSASKSGTRRYIWRYGKLQECPTPIEELDMSSENFRFVYPTSGGYFQYLYNRMEEDPEYLLDADMDVKGNVYTLSSRSWHSQLAASSNGLFLRRNGEAVKYYDFPDCMESFMVNNVDYNGMVYCHEGRLMGEDFQAGIYCRSEMGIDITHLPDEAMGFKEDQYYVLFDGKKSIIWEAGHYIDGEQSGRHSKFEYGLSNASYPIQDGMYLKATLIDSKEVYSSITPFHWEMYSTYCMDVYDVMGDFLFTLPGSYERWPAVNISNIGKKERLVLINGTLYKEMNGIFQNLGLHDVLNTRLKKIKDLSEWEKGKKIEVVSYD